MSKSSFYSLLLFILSILDVKRHLPNMLSREDTNEVSVPIYSVFSTQRTCVPNPPPNLSKETLSMETNREFRESAEHYSRINTE